MTTKDGKKTPPERRAKAKKALMGILLLSIALTLSVVMTIGFYWRERVAHRLSAETKIETKSALLLEIERWTAEHGRWFVTHSDTSEGLIETKDGVKLKELAAHWALFSLASEENKKEGLTIRIVGLHPLNPANLADDFEAKALKTLETSPKRHLSESLQQEGKEVLRLVYPMKRRPRCALCHKDPSLGKKASKILGGVSMIAPMGWQGEKNEPIRFALLMGGILLLGGLSLVYLAWQPFTQWMALQEEIRHSRMFDIPTGLLNRPALFEALEAEISRSRRVELPVSLMLIEIDHFDLINDRYGRKMGDAAIKQVSALIQENVRNYDIIGRTSGQEFLAVLPHTALEKAAIVGERIREAVETTRFAFSKKETPLSVSIGIAQLADANEKTDHLLSRTNTALTNAKANGHNRVEADDLYL